MKLNNFKNFNQFVSILLAVSFVSTSIVPPAMAQRVGLTPSLAVPANGFAPAVIRGVLIHPENPLKFDFIVDKGGQNLEGEAFRQEANKLIKYFLASLTIPESEMWVNLSPKEKNRIIPASFGQTEMGHDLLEQDLQLKQLAASLMGEEISHKPQVVSPKEQQNNPSTLTTYNLQLTTDLLSRIWIVPDSATVYENDKGAFVVKSHLKVMLEEDLNIEVSGKPEAGSENQHASSFTLHSSSFKNEFLSQIESAVNTSAQFATLRQIYNSMILATWYKKILKSNVEAYDNTPLGSYVDKGKIRGVNIADAKKETEKIYNQYLAAFTQGVYDHVQEEYDPATQSVIAKGISPAEYSSMDPCKRPTTSTSPR